MCLHLELLAAEGPRASLEHQMEDVFGINSQTTELGAVHFSWPGYSAGLAAIPV